MRRPPPLANPRPIAAGAAAVRMFAEDVRRGLLATPKQLQPKYLYDALGSRLFDAICELPWYRIPPAERQLLERHAPRVLDVLSDPAAIVELGCGNGTKLAILARALDQAGRRTAVHLIDISPAALDLTEHVLGPMPLVTVTRHEAAYEDGLRRLAVDRRAEEHVLVLFLGSNIGNFDPPEALALLHRIRNAVGRGDHLLLGVDLVKPEPALRLAYDDPLGVTAAFNRNLLARMNRELDADFDLRAFEHRAVWNAAASRVEMHLVSRRAQTVRIRTAGCEVAFDVGETIWTESSYKYEPDAVDALGETAGFRARERWIEPDARFCLGLFEAA